MLPASALAAPQHQQKKLSCVTLYEHIHFKGRSIKFCSNDKTLVNNNWNDLASSAKVSKGDGVVLYEHINYEGHKLKLKPGKYSDFTKKKLSKNRSWNNVVSSLRIK
ncbi:beta/gamma crystallin-related protein [Shimazuella kribbensis]|uniref:beta/gamma crystallin-related protein n=1 Tax=Shimazuella kribbensis TaxID=139808 RepID=UPI000A0381A5